MSHNFEMAKIVFSTRVTSAIKPVRYETLSVHVDVLCVGVSFFFFFFENGIDIDILELIIVLLTSFF